MANFSHEDFQEIDYELMQNSCITLFYRSEILNEFVKELEELNYKIVEFDCRTWKTVSDMFEQISDKLNFPDYFGKNLDALNDCLCDLDISDESGKALVFTRFDDFAKREGETAWHLLDIIAYNSRLYLLFGKRFFALIQSDNPKIRFDNLGSQSADWNRKEWLNKSRGL